MQKRNLSDVTFLIPVRIESPERHENIQMVIKFLKTRFITFIIVLEADTREKVKQRYIDKKIFIKDHDPVFHHTKYRNRMSIASTTPFIAVWDTDVLMPPGQIIAAVHMLRKNEADMVFPYDGNFLDTTSVIRNLYKVKMDMDILTKNKDKFFKPYGYFSDGGAFIVRRDAFLTAGMENENFYGWGAEDIERVKRWEILEYRVKRVEGPLFHLSHPRNENSWFGSNQLEKRNRGELLKICMMNKSELTKYVNSFKWVPGK